MHLARERAVATLFERLQLPGVGFLYASRKVIHWTKCTDQPAIFLVPKSDEYALEARGRPRKLLLHYELWIYARSNGDIIGDSVLNILIDNVEKVTLAPDYVGQEPVCTLKGADGVSTCNRCWIEGQGSRDPGDTDGQAFAKIPIKILLP